MKILLGLLAIGLMVAQAPPRAERWIACINRAADKAEQDYIHGNTKNTKYLASVYDCPGEMLLPPKQFSSMEAAKEAAKKFSSTGCRAYISKIAAEVDGSGRTGMGSCDLSE